MSPDPSFADTITAQFAAQADSDPVKPIRMWMHVGDRDLLNPHVMRDNMRDWVEANERMAKGIRHVILYLSTVSEQYPSHRFQ